MTVGGSGDVWLPWIKVAVREFDSEFGGLLSWGTYNGHEPTASRATDGMVPNYRTAAGNELGWKVARWLWANRKKYNIWYIIFDGMIISQTPGKGTWRKYTPTAEAIRNSPDSAWHRNHVHVSFYTDDPGLAPVGTVWIDLLVAGVKNSNSIRLVQKALGVVTTGTWDAATIQAARTFQESLGDTVDGFLGPKQVKALFDRAGQTVIIRTDPSGEAPIPDKKPTVVPEFVFVGGNILRETDDLPGRKRWPQRRVDVIRHLESAKPTVIGLCETDKSTAADVAEGLGADWSYYPSGFATNKEFSPLAIYWNTRVWARDGEVFVKEYSDNENRFLLRVPLRHLQSGTVVHFYVSHLENDGDVATDGHRARYLESREWASWTLDGPGVFYADLNSTTRGDTARPDARQKQKPRLVLVAKGWRMMTEQPWFSRVRSGHHSGVNSRPGNTPIDEVGFKGLTGVSGQVIDTSGTDASDHQFFTFRGRFKK